MLSESDRRVSERSVRVPYDGVGLEADLAVPSSPQALVLFAHGSGSSRHSPRNKAVASDLQQAGFATLLLDLLTVEEERAESRTGHFRFDIEMLSRRLAAATDWAAMQPELRGLPVGYFGASTGAAAALVAAAALPDLVSAIVSRGGRPDLAGSALPAVHAPTLLIVGGADGVVIDLNRQAAASMRAVARLEIIPRAGHLFEEPGALERVSELARAWFEEHLVARHIETASYLGAR